MSIKDQQPELLRDRFLKQGMELLWQPAAPPVRFMPVLVLKTLCPPKAPSGGEG